MSIKKTWDWWRHNHSMSFWSAVEMMLRVYIKWPLKSLYAWLWFRWPLNMKWKRELRKLRKTEEEVTKKVR